MTICGSTHCFVRNQQGVVWSGLRSNPSPIRCTPGISHRTDQFLICINNLPDNISYSLSIFVDDFFLNRNIYSIYM